MRIPAMHACRVTWPPMRASSARPNDASPRSLIRVVVRIGVDPRAGEQRLDAQLGRGLDALQRTRHLARPHLGLADRVDDRVGLALDVGEDVAEAAELGLD